MRIYSLSKEDSRPVLNCIKENDNNYELSDIILICDELNNLTGFVNSYVEHSYVIVFNSNNELIGCGHISTGNEYECGMYKRIILTYVCLLGGSKFFVVHNHSTGILFPSDKDINNYYAMKYVFDNFEYELIDSIILTKNGTYFIEEDINEDYIV